MHDKQAASNFTCLTSVMADYDGTVDKLTMIAGDAGACTTKSETALYSNLLNNAL